METLDYSKITENLYVGRTPHGDDYLQLKKMGINLIINMRIEWPPVLFSRQNIVEEIWAPTLDSPISNLNNHMVEVALEKATLNINSGGKVYVFCHKGRHRSVFMGAKILCKQGYNNNRIIDLISAKRPVADFSAPQMKRALCKM